MTDAYETGAIFTSTVPKWQRTWYEQQLLDNIRMNCILLPYARVVEDFNAVKTGTITYTEVQDAEPNWNTTTESTIWFKGGQLDSRTISIALNLYHDIMKFSDYNTILDYVANGAIPGVVREKLSRSLEETLDILARNAFLTHPNPTFAGSADSRATLTSSDYFDVDIAELARVHLEELEVPGVASNTDGGSQAIVCVTTPRVIHDIRTAAGSDWLDVQKYAGAQRKFNSEAGQWGGVRFVKTNRLRLRNAGLAEHQTTLNGASIPGQGAHTTVDVVYSPGQTGSTAYLPVTSSAGFAVGEYVTIHAAALGTTVLDADGTQETRRIVAIDSGGANRLAFDKPLLKDHLTGAYCTKALDIHASVFVGGPGIVYAVGERPNFYTPPKIDDAMMINRVGWRGMLKLQLFRPELFEIHYSGGSID
jgi:N4-gp56 family major capsid protein